jgi:hypothetical protein
VQAASTRICARRHDVTALLFILVTLALGYGAYLIVRNGLHFP